MFTLQDKWCVEDCEIVSEYASNKWGCVNHPGVGIIYHETAGSERDWHFRPNQLNGYQRLTLGEFKQFVLQPVVKVNDWICFLRPLDGRPAGCVERITNIRQETGFTGAGIRIIYENGGFRVGGNGYFINTDFIVIPPTFIDYEIY